MEVIVTLADGADAPRVVRGLAESGFRLQQDLGALGLLVGEAEPADLDRLRAVAGVLGVEPSVPISLPPKGPL